MQITLEGHAAPISANAGETILHCLLRAGLPFPFSCQSGNCGTCKCRLVCGEVAQLEHSEQVLGAGERADGLILACRAIVNGDVTIRRID
jgi:naphthalene 1,2-dioxygenase ferredoxin reductase component